MVVTPPRAIRHQREWVLEVQEVQSEKKAMRGRCVAIASEKFHKSLVKHIAASHASFSQFGMSSFQRVMSVHPQPSSQSISI